MSGARAEPGHPADADGLRDAERPVHPAETDPDPAVASRERVESESLALTARAAELEVELEETRFLLRQEERRRRRLAIDLDLLTTSLDRVPPSGSSPASAAAGRPPLDAAAMDTVHGLFDAAFYRRLNPDVVATPEGPLAHFLRRGGFEGRQPHPLFDVLFYLERNPDVRDSGVNPLLHFVVSGARERRSPHPLFDVGHYLAQVPSAERERPGFNPLLHFLQDGGRAGLDPHPLFATSFCREQLPEQDRESNPLVHFVTVGAWLAIRPHPLVDPAFLLAQQPPAARGRFDPLSRFLLDGVGDPHPFFSSEQYREAAGARLPAGANPLLHFVEGGRQLGLRPRSTFDRRRDEAIVEAHARRARDGQPVILFIGHIGGGGSEKHLLELAELVRGRRHVLHLRPANHHLLGAATASQLALSALDDALPGLLFDPESQLQELVGVLRQAGVGRLHIHHLTGNEGYLRRLVLALGVPFDFTAHDYIVLSPRFAPAGHPAVFPGDASEDVEPIAVGADATEIGAWRRSHGWLITEAERVLVPSVDVARRLGRALPGGRYIAAAHPERPAFDPLAVDPRELADHEPLRVVLLGEVLPHKGEEVIRAVARRLRELAAPIELHLVGFVTSGVPLPGVEHHGRYRDANLGERLAVLAPHVAWFPSQWPETYSYTLSAALRIGLPVVVTDLGAQPERVAGRAWSWVLPWTSSADAWCEALREVRRALLARRSPPPPPRREQAIADYYPERYLDVSPRA